MTTEITTYQPPGAMAPLFAAPHIETTVRALSNELLGDHPLQPTIGRQPSRSERERLNERKKQIRSLMQPASLSTAAQKRISDAIGKMLGGWLNLRVGSAPEVIAGWAAKLQELPSWAVCLACQEFEEGLATFRDENGKERTLSTEYAPSSATVFKVARGKLDALYAEAALIDRIMTAKLVAPVTDPVVQKRVGALLAGLAADMGATRRKEREERLAESTRSRREADERRDKFAKEADARRLARFAQLGLIPVYGGDGRICDADALPANLQHPVGGPDADAMGDRE